MIASDQLSSGDGCPDEPLLDPHHPAQPVKNRFGTPVTTAAQTDPGGGICVRFHQIYSAASRRGKRQPGRMKWQV